MKHINEPARETPVTGNYDVVIVGGGMAGVAAALAAVRTGAKVCIIERYCALGGLATIGNVTIWLPLCDGMGRQVIGGLGEELLKLSVADLGKDNLPARFTHPHACWNKDGNTEERKEKRYLANFNPSSYLLALEKLVTDSGIEIMYDTRFCAISKEGNSISHVVIENKSGRSALACKTVVDGTGDADVCYLAGEETESLDSNVLTAWFYTLCNGEFKLHQCTNHYSTQAVKVDAKGPFFRGDDAEQVTQHILQSRGLMRERLAARRNDNPDEEMQILMPAGMACFRMTRRLKGLATIGEKDMHQWFDDTVGLSGDWRKKGPVWAIPYRSLVGKTDNLLTAGRCFSVDTTAWDALRAIPTCTVTGQAAGIAAAMAAAGDGNAKTVKYDGLKSELLNQGVLLNPELAAKAG